MDEYAIPIHGLKEGVHNYEFKINNSFFTYFENPDLQGGLLDVNLSLQKRSQFFELEFHIKGSLNLVCDRCLEVFKFDVDFKEKLFVRLGDSFEELDDNIILIPRDESRLNVAHYIYEFAVLSIPYKKVHSDNDNSGCNPDMIKRLNELRVEENKHLNTDNIDPRWDKLKNLN
jgi:uncharacterized metal-binding protein YceD (DUF177 family)